jgi:signal transduction histidine kinase
MSQIKKILTNKYAIISAAVLVLGLVLSIMGSKFLFEYTKQQQQLWIERNAEAQSEQLQISITSALNVLSSISAFFKAEDNINQDRFFKFVKSDAAIKTGILALAWVPRVTHEQRKQFERDLNKELRGYRSITEMNSHGLLIPAPVHDEYFPVQHVFTIFDTELFTGLNITSQFNTRNNLNAAIETGQLLTTQGKRVSLQNPERKTFQAYFPVYDLENVAGSNQLGRNDLIGFAVGVFDIQTLVQNTFKNTKALNLILLDVGSVLSDQLLYKSNTDYLKNNQLKHIHDLSQLDVPYWTRYFDVGNRKWLGVFISDEVEGIYKKSWLPYLGLILGLLITSLLAIYLFIALLRGKQIHDLKYQLDGSEQLLTSQSVALNKQTKLSKKLESESHEKTRFLHALGHDLRQPLSTLGLYLAQFDFGKEDRNKQVLDKSKLTLKSLTNMFESMLEMTRLEAGTIHPEKINIDLRILFQSLQEEFELPLQGKELQLHIRCNDYLVCSDPVLLEVILRNLLTNAIKFTEKGKILLASRNLNNQTIIYIMDTGQGIDENKINEIFKPYTRGNAISSEIGLGLGLAIVMHAVDLLGHELDMSSKLDHGTCFRLKIDRTVFE